MNIDDPSHWRRCILCHDSLWLLGLSHTELLAYLYVSTFCHKEYPISVLIMAKVLHIDTKRLKRALDSLESRNMIKRGTYVKGRARTIMVIQRTSKTWGQTPLPLGSNNPTHLGSNAPTTWGQTPLLTASLDETFLSLFHTHFTGWTFNKKPIGRYFVFTKRMQSQALECMRSLHKDAGLSSSTAFEAFLSDCGEYLSLPRDVLSTGRDQRALSPCKWLNEWPEQIRLAGIYRDEKAHKVTRITEEVVD